MTDTPPDHDDPVARSARRKVAGRLLPLLLAMYVVAYLDRANLGFAKLQMGEALKDSGFDDAVFGRGVGLFFVGYLLLEIPGALLVERWSARKWFARILVSWGLCSMAMALVTTPGQFYGVRFLLGLAEAGFFPGVIVYFTHWFSRRDRAKALAGMLMAVPVSLAGGAAVSAVLLRLDWFGLAGWQWVFLVEGAPAVLLGAVVPFLLPDRPKDARWLTPAERDWLERTLDEERRETAAAGAVPIGRVLRLPAVWLLAVGIFCTNLGGYALVFWLPTVMKGLLTGPDGPPDDSAVLLWTLPVFVAGLVAVVASGWSSDRTGDRKWHCVAGQIGAGVFLALSVVPGQSWTAVVGWLTLAGFCAYFWIAPYWVLPTLALTSSAAAVAVGVINMCANAAGFVGNEGVGRLRKGGVVGDAECLLVLAGCYALGGVFVGLVRVRRGAG
ncbi:MAG: MFS transporter [Gemmataceae bacterium]|nr:MFS transporter [Gemmataceae bacterium]